MAQTEKDTADRPTMKNPLKGAGDSDQPVTLDSDGNPKQDVVAGGAEPPKNDD